MPVYELAEKMTYEELLGWFAYFERRPAGWREDDRTFKLLQAQGVKGKPWNFFPSLNAIYNNRKDDNPISSLKGSVLFQKMLTAKGGDSLDI